MPTHPSKIELDQLKKYVSRAVLRVPSTNPKTGAVDTHEVLSTLRPSWSKVGRYVSTLPGGKIELSDLENLSSEELEELDPHFLITLDQLVLAGLVAAGRELYEELGLILASDVLTFSEISTNKAGWNTIAYVADLPEKPTLLVQPDSAGTVWMDEAQILHGNPKMLAGHLGIIRRSLKKLYPKDAV